MGSVLGKQKKTDRNNIEEPIQMVFQSALNLKLEDNHYNQKHMMKQDKQKSFIKDKNRRNQRIQQFNNKSQLQQKMMFKQDMEAFSQEIIQQYLNNIRMQAKEQFIDLKPPILNEKECESLQQKEQRTNKLKKWLSSLCHSVFSIAYQSFKKGQMSESEMKVYCSENLLINIIKLSKENQRLTVQDYRFINEFLRDDILNFYKEKYPPTLSKQSFKKFRNVIKQINAMDDFQNELIKGSKLEKQFLERYKSNKNHSQFYDLIMRFINYCVQLPDKNGKGENKKQNSQKSHYEQFYQLMANIFSKVEDINYMKKKYFINKTQQQINEEQRYRQKVKQYTKYQIGRKIPEDERIKFTDYQIKNSDIQIRDPTILRFLTKWLQELEETLKYVQSTLKSIGQWPEYWNIARVKGERNKLLNEVQKKFYQQQLFCNYNYLNKKKIDEITNHQKLVGTFSCIASQNLSAYIIKSINSILRDLCELTSRNQQFIFPSITCKIGDLMRCKCSSKQEEILNIYQQIQQYSINKPQVLKIVRIKNRLQKNTRDILINAFFNNTILCQIQLSINLNDSKEGLLNSFNHYLYELQRSKFGPINQLANVWTKDQRFSHMMKLVDKPTKKSLQNQCKCLRVQMIKEEDPFICSCCDRYYGKNVSFISHKKCDICQNWWKCSNCQFNEIVKTSKNKEQLLKEYSKKDECTYLDPSNENVEIPAYGMYISKLSKTKQFVQFKKFDLQDQQNFYLVKIQRDKGMLINDSISKEKQKSFFKDKAVFSISNIKQLQNFGYDNFIKELLLPKIVKQTYKKQSTTFNFASNTLTTEQFLQITGDDKQNSKNHIKIKSLNLTRNKIEDCTSIFNRFPNIQTLNLRYNQLTEIPLKSIKNYKNMKILNLSNNQITLIAQLLGEMVNLTQLNISYNKISQLPSSIGNLKKLTRLNIRNNYLSSLPQSIGNLVNLAQFNFHDNPLSSLPQSIGNLTNLTKLYFYDNRLSYLPQSIGNLTNLTELSITDNKLSSLPESIGNLTNLARFQFYKNKLSSLPQSIGNLKNLTYLMLHDNLLSSLPQSIGNLVNLTNLSISNNQLTYLPQSIGNLINLIELKINNNQLSQLPQSLGNLTKLIWIHISYNQLSSLPQSIGNLIDMPYLDMSQNKLSYLPQSIGNLINLTDLKIINNQLSSLPQSIGNLTNLRELDLKNNELSLLPQSIGNLVNLKKLDIGQNKLSCLPQSIGNMSELIEFLIPQNQVSFLPQSIGNLINLQWFQISSNQVSFLPQSIGHLVNLRFMDIAQNSFVIDRQFLLFLVKNLKCEIGMSGNIYNLNSQDLIWLEQNNLKKRFMLPQRPEEGQNKGQKS